MQRHDTEGAPPENASRMGNGDFIVLLCPDSFKPMAGNPCICSRDAFRICVLQDGVTQADDADALRQQHICGDCREDGQPEGCRLHVPDYGQVAVHFTAGCESGNHSALRGHCLEELDIITTEDMDTPDSRQSGTL